MSAVSLQNVLLGCAGSYAVVILIELLLRKKWLRFLFESAVLIGAIVVDVMINNAETGRVSFGQGASPFSTVGIMLAAIVLGIGARYVFYMHKGQFDWLDFFKPIVISPIVLLPLIGSVQTTGELSQMQIVSFAVLAFQNGFFWQAVLEGAKPVSQTSIEKSAHASNLS